MSRFTDDFSRAFESDVLFEMGDQIEYHPLGLDARNIDAVVNEKASDQRDGQSHATQFRILSVSCLKSSLSKSPRTGDYVVWETKRWDFDRQFGDDGGVLRLQFVREEIQTSGIKPVNL